MTKKIYIAITLVVVALGSYYLYLKNSSTNIVTSTIRVPVSYGITQDNVQAYSNAKDISASFVDPTKNITVSFRGAIAPARDPGSNLYVGQTKVGEVGGIGVVDGSFSPDSKYFAFRTLSICGAGCQNTMIHVLDTTNSSLSIVFPPRKDNDFTGDETDLYVEPHIESYSWTNTGLRITFFFLGKEKVGVKAYRVSPKEVWDYNPTTKEYSLVEVLPE